MSLGVFLFVVSVLAPEVAPAALGHPRVLVTEDPGCPVPAGGGDGLDSGSYAFAARWRAASFPVHLLSSLADDDFGRTVFVRTAPMWGGVIREFVPNGPVGFCAGAIIVAGGSGIRAGSDGYWHRGGGSAYGGQTSHAYLSFDIGDDTWNAAISGWVAPFFGYRVGANYFHALVTGYETPVHKLADGSISKEILTREEMSYISSGKLQGDLTTLWRLAAPLGLGSVDATLEVPVLDLLVGWTTFLWPGSKSFLLAFGHPRLTLGATQTRGLLWLRAEVSVPTELIVVPWHLAATQVTAEAGLKF